MASVHDRASARALPRFTLTVYRVSHGCGQQAVFEGLLEHEVEEEKRAQRELYPYPWYSISFDVSL